jgi:sigma-E factor negative regulatory protein RseA
MNETMRESISALMDGESDELEFERILSRVGTDQELRQTWARYAIAQQAAHGHDVAHPQWDISTRVHSALVGADTYSPATRATVRQRFLRPLTSFAVAASVALTVVIGGRQLALIDSATPYEHGDRAVATGTSPVGLVNSLGATSVRASYGTQEAIPVLQPATRTAYRDLAQLRLRQYMQEHAEQAALNSPQGLVPFARVPEIRK